MTEDANMTEDSMVVDNNSENSLVGRVNWFNRRKGFGFITVVTPNIELTNTDVFFHFSEIKTDNFKIVYPGEYVSFTLGVNDTDQEGRSICKEITGVYGNELLTDNEKYNIRVTEKRNNENKNTPSQ